MSRVNKLSLNITRSHLVEIQTKWTCFNALPLRGIGFLFAFWKNVSFALLAMFTLSLVAKKKNHLCWQKTPNNVTNWPSNLSPKYFVRVWNIFWGSTWLEFSNPFHCTFCLFQWAYTLVSINQLLTILNSSFNFLIYLSFCGRGRRKNKRRANSKFNKYHFWIKILGMFP